jgi:hypothetical protein
MLQLRRSWTLKHWKTGYRRNGKTAPFLLFVTWRLAFARKFPKAEASKPVILHYERIPRPRLFRHRYNNG